MERIGSHQSRHSGYEGQYSMKDVIRDILFMKDDIRPIKRVQGQVWKLAARVSNFTLLIPPLMTHSKNHNLYVGAGDSDDPRFEVVPFPNGRDPTKDPVSSAFLPHLLQADAPF
jgi:hypothetical protein